MMLKSQCLVCRHFDRADPELWRCTAFPDGIPESIYLNKVDHRQPVEGDGGIRFEALPIAPAGYHPMNKRPIPVRPIEPGSEAAEIARRMDEAAAAEEEAARLRRGPSS